MPNIFEAKLGSRKLGTLQSWAAWHYCSGMERANSKQADTSGMERTNDELKHSYRRPATRSKTSEMSEVTDTLAVQAGQGLYLFEGHTPRSVVARRVTSTRLGWPTCNDPKLIALLYEICLLYTSPSPRDQRGSRMPSSA